MSNVPPTDNLAGPSMKWGRWVTSNIQAALKGVNNLEQERKNANKEQNSAFKAVAGSGGTTSVDSKGFTTVKDYGAVGDGTHDDTSAIQTAVNFAAGRIVLFPIGNYRITNLITIPNDNTYLLGAGGVLIANGFGTTDPFIFNDSANTHIDGLQFVGAGVNIFNNVATGGIFENCLSSGSTYFLQSQYCSGLSVRNNKTSTGGMLFQQVDDSTIFANEFTGATLNTIGGNRLQIVSNYLVSTPGAPSALVLIDQTASVTDSDFTIKDNRLRTGFGAGTATISVDNTFTTAVGHAVVGNITSAAIVYANADSSSTLSGNVVAP